MDHPSNYALEEHSVAVLTGDGSPEVVSHVATCETCRAHLKHIERERHDLQARLPTAAFMRGVMAEREQQTSSRQWLENARAWPGRIKQTLGWNPAWAMALVVLMAVGVGAWFTTNHKPAPRTPEGDSLRVMGSAAPEVSVFVKSRAGVRRVDAEVRVSAGDAVRFALRAPERGYVAIFFMSESGELSWIVPSSPDAPPRQVEAGMQAVAGSAIFDGSRQTERSFVVFKPHLFDPKALATRVLRAWRHSTGLAFTDPGWVPTDPGIRSTLFYKR